MNMTPHLEERIQAAEQILASYEKNPECADHEERAIYNALTDIVESFNSIKEEAARQKAKDEKDDTIRTPMQLRKKFERMFERQLADPTDMSTWDMIVEWGREYMDDSTVESLLRTFWEAHRDDKEDAMQELFQYLLYNTDCETYGVGKKTTLDFTLYGGGPGGGLEFTYDEDGDLDKAEMYHVEWWGEPVRITLDSDEAERLAEVYRAREIATGEF